MERLSPFWQWIETLPKNVLDLVDKDIIETFPWEDGKIFTGDNKEIRDSNVILLPGIHWFGGILSNYAFNANIAANWNMELTVSRTIQIAEYNENQHYDWHVDTDIFSINDSVRKLTAICFLSNPEDYEGGELELEYSNKLFKPPKGSVIVFPSLMRHRVKPVTSGKRLTATTWIEGPNKRYGVINN